MKIVFISGPYRAAIHYQIEQNIRAAEAVAIKYWKLGYAVYCPHKNTSHFDGLMDDDTWLKGNLAILLVCDIIVMMKDWRLSMGAKAELDLASKMGKEIIYE